MLIQDRIQDFLRCPSAKIRPNERNWRVHPVGQTDALKALLSRFGTVAPALVYRMNDGGYETEGEGKEKRHVGTGTFKLIDGHARTEILGGDNLIPICVLDVSEEEADGLLLTFDPVTNLAGADLDRLEALMKDNPFDEAPIQQMLADLVERSEAEQPEAEKPEAGQGGDEFDATPAPDEEPTRTHTGDLWLIGGKHKLIVGDSTDAAVVARLMGDDRATCVFTDPPYGVSIGAKNRMLNEHQKSGRNLSDIEDDDASADELKARLVPAFVNYRTIVMAEDCTMFVCTPQMAELSTMMVLMMAEAGVPARHILIWKKNAPTFSMGRLDYDYQHEPILLTWGKRHKKLMKGDHTKSVWEVDKPRAAKEHPTMKPVALYVNAYLNHTEEGEVVADLYAGSGTAVIAAHRTNRVARCCELMPKFADVILRRAEVEGMTCELIGKAAGSEEA